MLTLRDGVNPFVVVAKQCESERNVFLAMKVETDPTRVREVMVWRHLAAGNEFIAYRAWEREIRHCVAMKVSDFPSVDAKLAPAETMPSNGYVRPTQQLAFDRFADFKPWFHNSVFS